MNVDDNENDNENENERKKNVRATPGLLGENFCCFVAVASRHLDVLINWDIPGLKVSTQFETNETTDDTARRHATITRSLQDASCK